MLNQYLRRDLFCKGSIMSAILYLTQQQDRNECKGKQNRQLQVYHYRTSL